MHQGEIKMNYRVVISFAVALFSIAALSLAEQVVVSLDPATTIAKPDSHFFVCIDLQGLEPDMFISSVEFTLTFDTCVVFWDSTITFDGTCLDSSGWDIKVHNESYRDLDVWMIGGQMLQCNGCVLRIGFLVNASCVQACGGESTLLEFSRFVINESEPGATTHDGSVIVNRGPYFTDPEDGTEFYVNEGPTEGCNTLCYTLEAVDPDGDSLSILWLANDSTLANGATLDTVGPGMWKFCWAPPKRVGNSLAGECYPDTFIVYSTCGAGGLGSSSCCLDTIIVTTCVDSLHLHAFWPDTTDYHACGQVKIPLYLETNYGLCFEDLHIYAFDITLRYDTEHLNAFEVGNVGLITQHLGALTYGINEDAGLISIAMGFNDELTGCRMPEAIVYVGFEVAGATEASSNLELSIDHVKANEGYPRVCWENGFLHVVNFSIEGDVLYSDNGTPISDAKVKIWAGDSIMTSPADDTVYTDTNGHYGIGPMLGCSDYCVKVQMDPLDMPDPTQVITSLDAAYILMHIGGTMAFSHNDSLAADITGNGTISGYDVALLLQEIVGFDTEYPIGEWIFEPAFRCYANVSASRTGEDYEGVIIGDVTQNWPNEGTPKSGIVYDPDVIIDDRIREKEEEEETYFTFPITFSKTDGIIAASFRVSYNPEVLTAIEAKTTEISASCSLACKIDPGEIRVAMAGSRPLSGSGAIVEIEFKTTSDEIDLEMDIWINEPTIIEFSFPIKVVFDTTPSGYALFPNHPNPFNPCTSIRFSLPDTRCKTQDTRQDVSLKIYNILGQEVRSLIDELREPGYYTVTWDGRDERGNDVSSGIYYYRLQAGNFVSTKKMILMK